MGTQRGMIKKFYWSLSKVPIVPVRFQRHLISQQIYEKHSNIKFHENPSSGSRVVSYGRTDRWTDGKTYVTHIIVAFRNFAKAH